MKLFLCWCRCKAMWALQHDPPASVFLTFTCPVCLSLFCVQGSEFSTADRNDLGNTFKYLEFCLEQVSGRGRGETLGSRVQGSYALCLCQVEAPGLTVSLNCDICNYISINS